jgi:phosphoglucosamine mutase
MEDETIALIEDYLDGKLEVFGQMWENIPYAHQEDIGCSVDFVAGRNRYIGYLISLGLYSFRGKRIGLDCANGSAWNIAPAVFEALGAKVYVIGNEPNGLNVNGGVGSTHIEALQQLVVEKGLDVGFAYDGDADRCLCVDETGKVIDGDLILYICGRHMKEQGTLLNNTVVTTVMSNLGLYKAFDKIGINYVKTAVGDKYVYEHMHRHGERLGGEQSGHIIFSKYATTGDGILTSLKLMEVMLAQKQTLSQLCEGLTIYPQELKSVRAKDQKAALAAPAVKAAIEEVKQELGDTGRILVRCSGTEPVVRVMVEAPTQQICKAQVEKIAQLLQQADQNL